MSRYANSVLSLILVVLVTAFGWGSYRTGQKSVQQRWDRERAQQAQEALQISEHYRAREQAAVAALGELEKRYDALKKSRAVDAAGARSELGSLRDAIAAAPGCPAPADPSAATRAAGRARLEQELLAACAGALVNLAQEADRLESVVVGLQGYVKGVCLGGSK